MVPCVTTVIVSTGDRKQDVFWVKIENIGFRFGNRGTNKEKMKQINQFSEGSAENHCTEDKEE